MSLSKLPIKFINFYQTFISPMLGNNCRYYPSCSEYTKMEFKFDSPIRAFFKSSKRILTCNQLFEGGIDFPVIKKSIKIDFFIKKPDKIEYWLVPIKDNRYLVIKVL